MFDFHRFMLYNIFFLLTQTSFRKRCYCKKRSKITYCSYDYQAKSEDYFQFFMFRTVLNNRRYIFRFEGIRKGKPKTFR